MPNKSYAVEWLDLSKRNLETAEMLFNHHHYNDVIAIDIHQSIEKAFKAIYAYYGIAVPRTHILGALYEFVSTKIELDITIDHLLIISDYYDSERYPGPKYFLPSNEEIETNIQIAQNVFSFIDKHIRK